MTFELVQMDQRLMSRSEMVKNRRKRDKIRKEQEGTNEGPKEKKVSSKEERERRRAANVKRYRPDPVRRRAERKYTTAGESESKGIKTDVKYIKYVEEYRTYGNWEVIESTEENDLKDLQKRTSKKGGGRGFTLI